MKALSLIILYSLVTIISLVNIIGYVKDGVLFDHLGSLTGIFISPMLIILLLRGKLKFVSYFASLFFALILPVRFVSGNFHEYYVIYYAILILWALILLSRRGSILIIIFCLLNHTAVYIIKSPSQEFSSNYLISSLFIIFVISLLGILNLEIIKYYLKRVSKRKDILEVMVRERTEALRREKEYTEQLFHQSPSAIFTTDIEKKVMDFNNKAEAITGYTREEVTGQTFDVFCADGCCFGGEKRDNLAENECKILTKEGKHKIIERHTSQLHNSEGEVIGDIESFIDLTEWKELEGFKADMERVIRHDLKTPLNTIIGFPEMMLEEENLTEEHRQMLKYVHNAGRNMLNLILTSQDLYKLEQGSFVVHKGKTDVLSIIRQIDIDLTEMKKNKQCAIVAMKEGRFLEDRDKVIISTEKTLLYMILSNLIKNALEASPKDKPVAVELEGESPVVLKIRNSGVIPPEIRDSFFNKYVTAQKKGGTGLGTYSAMLAAKAIGAELSFEIIEEKETELTLLIPS